MAEEKKGEKKGYDAEAQLRQQLSGVQSDLGKEFKGLGEWIKTQTTKQKQEEAKAGAAKAEAGLRAQVGGVQAGLQKGIKAAQTGKAPEEKKPELTTAQKLEAMKKAKSA